jgi:hypothetical protein
MSTRDKKHEQIGRAIAPIFRNHNVQICRARQGSARELRQSIVSGFRRSKLQDALDQRLQHRGRAHPPSGRHRCRRDLRNAPHLPELRLQVVLGQTPAYRLARQLFVLRQPDHRAGQKFECPAFTSFRRARADRCHPPAVSLPDGLRVAPGRAPSLSARSRLPSTKRCLVR